MSVSINSYDRYASKDMIHLFSNENKYKTWRDVWIVLAEAQYELGFPIKLDSINKCKETIYDIDYARVAEIEAVVNHDVMAHLKYWAEICSDVNNAIHLGATSSYVTDNAECVLIKNATKMICSQVEHLVKLLKDFAVKTASIPVIGYTHFQPASPTTIGKRVALWIQDIYNDLIDIKSIKFLCRGAKGTTGTQASYFELVDGNIDKVFELDKLVAYKLGMEPVPLSGQTITRKYEVKIANMLADLAITLNKIGNDIRLLSHTGDLFEGFMNGQIGSSAMPYKKNPILSERLCSLSRMIIHYRNMLVETASNQWLERSLDDSAIRRSAIPGIFLAANGALNTAIKIASQLCCNNLTFQHNIAVFASEILLAKAVKNGHDRQKIHSVLQNIAFESNIDDNPDKKFKELVIQTNIWPEDDFILNLDKISIKDLIGLADVQTILFVKNIV